MVKNLLPHECLFGIYLVQMVLRLIWNEGLLGRDTLVFFGLLAVNVGLIQWCLLRPTSVAWRLRLLFYPVAMNLCFFMMKTAVPAIQPWRADAFLQQVDTLLVGRNLCLQLEPAVHPLFTEILSLCYLLFFPNLFVGMVYYFIGDLDLLKRFFAGLFSVYGIGFIGYSLFPAVGPYVDMAPEFRVPLEGWLITGWNDRLVRMGTNGVDVFPSLHCAVSAFILFFDRKHRPWRFRLYVVPAVGLWISTIYLRYHYLIDVICGFILAACCYWMATQSARMITNSKP